MREELKICNPIDPKTNLFFGGKKGMCAIIEPPPAPSQMCPFDKLLLTLFVLEDVLGFLVKDDAFVAGIAPGKRRKKDICQRRRQQSSSFHPMWVCFCRFVSDLFPSSLEPHVPPPFSSSPLMNIYAASRTRRRK